MDRGEEEYIPEGQLVIQDVGMLLCRAEYHPNSRKKSRLEKSFGVGSCAIEQRAPLSANATETGNLTR